MSCTYNHPSEFSGRKHASLNSTVLYSYHKSIHGSSSQLTNLCKSSTKTIVDVNNCTGSELQATNRQDLPLGVTRQVSQLSGYPDKKVVYTGRVLDGKTPSTPCLLLVFPYVLLILTVKYQIQSWITLGLTRCCCSLLTLKINK